MWRVKRGGRWVAKQGLQGRPSRGRNERRAEGGALGGKKDGGRTQTEATNDEADAINFVPISELGFAARPLSLHQGQTSNSSSGVLLWPWESLRSNGHATVLGHTTNQICDFSCCRVSLVLS